MTLAGLIGYLQQEELFPNKGEITETDFDRWLENALRLPDEGEVYYIPTGEFIKYKRVNGELQIVSRRLAD